MKPRLKYWSTDFWKGVDPASTMFHGALSEHYDIVLDEHDPELLVFSCFGVRNLGYRCKKLFYTGENVRPDFAVADFACTFDYTSHPRHYRISAATYNVPELVQRSWSPEDELAAKKRFCGFVVSNPCCYRRNEFFRKLSKYKKVDSGGRVMNNMGGRVRDKQAFMRECKFGIAFENTSHPGYITEKIRDSFVSRSVPIYWGDPLANRDFNPASFLHYDDYGSDEALIERVIELDNNDDLYLEHLRASPLHNNKLPEHAQPGSLLKFLRHVIDSDAPLVSHSPGFWKAAARSAARQKGDIWQRRLGRWGQRAVNLLRAQ